MDRRLFLIGTGALALGPLLAACGAQEANGLKIRLLKNAIPPQLPGKFRQSLQGTPLANPQLDLIPEIQMRTLFSLLEIWQKNAATPNQSGQGFSLPFTRSRVPTRADLVTLGDYWLAAAIQKQFIQPLNPQHLTGWEKLPKRWQMLVTRDLQGNLDPQGQVWGAPYRWGSTLIAYRVDKFKEKGWAPPSDWADLWRPEFRGLISLLDQPREVIGLTLKKLGQSYNTRDLGAILQLKQELQNLHRQTLFYSSNHYLQPLLLGDTYVAVGWSTDILPIVQTDPKIAAIVPAAGTALWSEVWVRPVASSSAAFSQTAEALAEKWIGFCWQPEIAQTLSTLSDAVSPLLAEVDRATLPEDLQNRPSLLPDPEVLRRSDFLEPLPEETLKQYRQLWTEIRQMNG
ncbi:polyamine ABC transporter substrate-binding protein [Leptolyngbya sp. 'hensonii']|uniref:extracellular solute-binding protein n=1 Tax=Leptolyngbya sp. 'hensonii' TaxID=1922337 RepID=UPI00095012CC|nr:extracellular solute-binding protein [Leptolyngbya sp. 'hensonii']OLP18173.1 polyamine ABC transporter substrate-binding protein [Leptolyngbya sp. 'hensonii']